MNIRVKWTFDNYEVKIFKVVARKKEKDRKKRLKGHGPEHVYNTPGYNFKKCFKYSHKCINNIKLQNVKGKKKKKQKKSNQQQQKQTKSPHNCLKKMKLRWNFCLNSEPANFPIIITWI